MSKVLIIEDDHIVANIYRNKLRVENFLVETAVDGETGFEALKKFCPDVCIVDLVLPRITGVDLIRKIRTEPGFEKIPIIVFSNTYLITMVQDAWKAGATKCLSKASCTPKQVIEAIRSVLGASIGEAPQPAPAATATIAAAAAPSPAASKPAIASDAAFQDELRQSFIATLPDTLTSLRTLMKALTKAEDEPSRLKQTYELYRRVRSLTGNAGVAGMPQIAQFTDALEALLKELHENPKTFNASTLRTVATAIDFLGQIITYGTAPGWEQTPATSVLVVDDEAISRRAVTYALDKARLKSVAVEDPNVAYQMLTTTAYDLVILDVDMPEMNGFELCTKLRTLPRYKKTPVVFVTVLTDFESRANSTMSGGNDFIAKPFLFVELAVKALIYVFRTRLESLPRPASAAVAPTPALAAR